MISSRSSVLPSDRMPVVAVRVAMSDSSDPWSQLPMSYPDGAGYAG